MLVDETALKQAAEAIRGGKLVAFPTETVYGLGANALDADAVARIFAAKQRPWASPLIVHVADERMARTIAADWPPLASKLASQFWPGPLTLVVRKAGIVPDVVTANLPSVGIRIPAHPLALALIRAAGLPIAAPSANPFTGISPTTAGHVRKGLGAAVDIILDGGPTRVGIESTVLALHRHPPEILRLGMLTRAQLEAAAGIAFDYQTGKPELVDRLGDEAPGQHPRHYAPRTPLYILQPDEAPPPGRGRILDLPATPAEYAASLYAELHLADDEGWDWIALTAPPDTADWAGIRDRLQRASVKR